MDKLHNNDRSDVQSVPEPRQPDGMQGEQCVKKKTGIVHQESVRQPIYKMREVDSGKSVATRRCVLVQFGVDC